MLMPCTVSTGTSISSSIFYCLFIAEADLPIPFKWEVPNKAAITML